METINTAPHVFLEKVNTCLFVLVPFTHLYKQLNFNLLEGAHLQALNIYTCLLQTISCHLLYNFGHLAGIFLRGDGVSYE